jgi:lambda family phage portal protein
MNISNALDRLIGVFSPERELRRKYFRNKLFSVNRQAQYAAAKSNRLTGAWSPLNSNVNDIIRMSASNIRARVRQLVRDFPYFTRAVSVISDYTVGSGIMFQSRVKDDEGKLNKKVIQQIEDSFNFWADQADVGGRMHYYEIMELAKRQDLETGEFIVVKSFSNRPRYLPFGLQMYESEWLADQISRRLPDSRGFSQGVEYNKKTGRIIAYHFTDPDGWGKTTRIPVADVIHGFQTLRPGQLRGVSPFAPAVLVAHDLSDYMDAEIDAAKMASKYLAFVKTPSPLERQLGVEVDSDTGHAIDEMENAIIEYLRPGEEIDIATNTRPGTNFPPFVKLILTMVAVTLNIPYELLSGDYAGMNYSTARTVRNDFAHQLRPISTRHIRHFAMPAFKEFMNQAVIHGKLRLPGYFTDPTRYFVSEWQPPGMESIDPLRESKARVEEIKAGLRSPYEIVKGRGRDLEDVYTEIANARDLAETLNLEFKLEKPQAGMANNPAAISSEKSEEIAKVVRLDGGV